MTEPHNLHFFRGQIGNLMGRVASKWASWMNRQYACHDRIFFCSFLHAAGTVSSQKELLTLCYRTLMHVASPFHINYVGNNWPRLSHFW